MSNEVLWILYALVNFVLIVGIYKIFGKTGLFGWIALGTILANILVTKSIDFQVGSIVAAATLGNIMYGTLFLVTDALGEKYGKKEAQKAVFIGFYSLIAMVCIMTMALWFTPNADDFAHDSLVTIFSVVPRIALGSLIAYAISQSFDVYLFHKIKEKLPQHKHLYIRNIGSTVVSQLIDTSIFVPIAFYRMFPHEVVIEIFITTYIIKVLVALLDTPFVYLMKRITPSTRFED